MALLLMCGLGVSGVLGARQMARWLVGDGGTASWWLVWAGSALAFLVIAVFASLVLAQPLSGWALEAIVRKQEKALTGRCPPEPGFVRSLWISVRCAVATLLVGAAVTVPLFLAGFLFPPALVVTVPLNYLVVGWLLAWDFLDYPLGLRGRGVRARAAWVRRHLGPFTAFGLAWATVLLIPGVALLVLPMGVAGAARLVVATEPEVLEVLPG
jgi:CysZ protein